MQNAAWWWLIGAGALIGWALGWIINYFIDRKVKPTVIETIVEKEIEKVVEKVIDRPVDRIVEKQVPVTVQDPKLIERIHGLEIQVNEIPGLHQKIAELQNERLALTAQNNSLRSAVKPLVQSDAHRAAVSHEIKAAVQVPVSIKKPTMKQVAQLNMMAARNAGVVVAGEDDLQAVEGIGPRAASILTAAGIETLSDLASQDAETVCNVLANAGMVFRRSDAQTWPLQAQLACNNQWDELRRVQQELQAGVIRA